MTEISKKPRFTFVQMEQYTPPSAIEKVTGNRPWVSYGNNNDFLDELISLYYGSPTHSAIINGVADMIVGGGLTSPIAAKRPDAYARALSLFRDEDVRRWAFDLKHFGYFIIQVLREGKAISCLHTPVENWRSGRATTKGEVEDWYFCDDWSKANDKKYAPIPVPVYSKEGKEARSVIVVKPFRTGTYYYPAVDYMGALEYARIEKEVATFHLNNLLNGLFPGLLINFNNGDPGEEEREQLESKIKQKWGGAQNAGRFILAFNDNKDSAATIEAPPLTDLDKQYEFISRESSLKIMIGHRVTSPLIFGIRAEGGLGNNANELSEAYRLFSATVLDPFRRIMINAFEGLLNDLGSPLPLQFKDNAYFATKPEGAQPAAFTLSDVAPRDITEEEEEAWLAHLDACGEEIDPEEWELVMEEPVDTQHIALGELDGEPQEKSQQDRGLYKIRYAYAPPAIQDNSRTFCRAMVDRSKNGKVYRKEDIVRMGDAGVNGQFAARGESTYSIWLYKGGVNCHHYWTRRVYFRKRSAGKFLPKSKTDKLENEKEVTVGQARAAGVEVVKNPREVATRPIDMPNNGRKN